MPLSAAAATHAAARSGGPARMSANSRGETDASAFSDTASIDQ